MTTIFCQMCGAGVRPFGDIPASCPCCRLLTIWSTSDPLQHTKPAAPVIDMLSSGDKDFLLRIRIAIE